MKKCVAVLTPPQGWEPLCKEYDEEAEFLFVSPLKCVPRDDACFSNFLMDLFSSKFSAVVMTSPTVVQYSVEMADGRGMRERFLNSMGNVEVIVIGNRSAEIAKRKGLKVSSICPEVSTDSLVEHLNKLPHRGEIALIRSDRGSKLLPSRLEAGGWSVTEVPIYSMNLLQSEDMEILLDRIEDGEISALIFPSATQAEAFFLQLRDRNNGPNVGHLLKGVLTAVMGNETKIKLEELGIKVDIVPRTSNAEVLIHETICRL